MLKVDNLSVSFKGHRVLENMHLELPRGETLGVVGESGSGKSTLAKCIVGQVTPVSGTIHINGEDVLAGSRGFSLKQKRQTQLVPQDPYGSLNPRHSIAYILAEALNPKRPNARRDKERIAELLELVNLPANSAKKYPYAFSGGQRQRIAIARALAVNPALLIADEITSALDVSVQAEILKLIERLQGELDLTILFISHNLAVVQQVCDSVVVLKSGLIVERGSVAEVFQNPKHAYTQNLLDSVPGGPNFSIR